MTLHHIDDLSPVLDKLYTMLNFGGNLCIVDLDREDGSFHGNSFKGHNGFDRHWLSELLKDTGFTNVESEICFTLKRSLAGRKQEYDLFLMVGRKIASKRD
jgi:hypothetical protein